MIKLLNHFKVVIFTMWLITASWNTPVSLDVVPMTTSEWSDS